MTTRTEERTTYDLEYKSRIGWKCYYPTNTRAPGRPPYTTLEDAKAALSWVLTESHPSNRNFEWRIMKREQTTTITEKVCVTHDGGSQ